MGIETNTRSSCHNPGYCSPLKRNLCETPYPGVREGGGVGGIGPKAVHLEVHVHVALFFLWGPDAVTTPGVVSPVNKIERHRLIGSHGRIVLAGGLVLPWLEGRLPLLGSHTRIILAGRLVLP